MAEVPKSQSWWQTLPGILTAIAAIITAIAGLVVALYQAGFFQHNKAESVSASSAPSRIGASSHAEAPMPDAHSASIASSGPVTLPSKSINLVASEAGGHLIAASSDAWVSTIYGKEEENRIYGVASSAEAVYAFKNEIPATLDMFTMLIPGTSEQNVKQFELFIGNDSQSGAFESIGKFQTQNVKLFKTPYQEFRFPPVKAKYLKIKLLATYGASFANVPEVQLVGTLEKK